MKLDSRNFVTKVKPPFFETVVSCIAILLTFVAPRWWLVNAGSDDLLYVKQALALRSGHWLGLLQDGAGLKVPGFPVFLAFLSCVRLPLFVAIALLQIIGAFLIRRYLIENGYKRASVRIIFLFTVLNPGLFGYNNSRVIRDGFYSTLLVICFGALLNIHTALNTTYKKTLSRKILFPAFFVFSATFIAYTREETVVFLLFTLLFIALLFLFSARNGRAIRKTLCIGMALFLTIGLFGLCIFNLNRTTYGAGSISYIESGPLTTLINQWSRVNPVSSNPRILISHIQREIIYKNIPEIGDNSKLIEQNMKFYQNVSCSQSGVCDDVGSGWTYWGLFYAIQSPDFIGTSSDFNVEVATLSKMMSKYCLGTGNCDLNVRIPTIGAPKNLIAIIGFLPIEMFRSFSQQGNGMSVPPSSGNQNNVDSFRKILPYGGPPRVLSDQKIGFGRLTYLITLADLLFGVFSLALVVRSKLNYRKIWKAIIPIYYLFAFILFRVFVTSTISVIGWDVSGSNYELPANILFWIFNGFLISILLESSDAKSKRRSIL